jgi:hypothetical protein
MTISIKILIILEKLHHLEHHSCMGEIPFYSYSKCHYAECRMLSFIMQSVILVDVIILSVITRIIIMIGIISFSVVTFLNYAESVRNNLK